MHLLNEYIVANSLHYLCLLLFLGKPEDFFPSQHEIGGGGANLVTCWWISTQKCRALFSYSTTIRVPEEKKNPIFCTLVCHAAFSKVSIYMPLCNRIGFIFSHLLGICLITDFCTLFVFSFFEILFLFSCRILNFHPQVWSTKPEMKYGKLLKPCYDSVKKRAPIFIGLFCSK